MAWLAALGALAGLAFAAPRSERAPDAPVPVALPDATPEAETSWHAARPNVVLSRPPASGRVVAGKLAVVGRLESPGDTVIVSIRTRREHLIDSDRVATSLDGLGFEASLMVPGPSEGGEPRRVWLEVIGYTYDGVPVAGTVAVLRVHAPPPARPLGEDGGMGGLGTGEVDGERPSLRLWVPAGRLGGD